MLYELRTYTVMPGRMGDLNRRFADITMGYFAKYGINVVGFWTNELGGPSDQLIYMLSWDSLADRETKWAAFGADRERIDAFRETEKNGPLVAHITAHILRPKAQSSAPRPGPTLALQLTQRKRFRRLSLAVRIAPVRSRQEAAAAARRLRRPARARRR